MTRQVLELCVLGAFDLRGVQEQALAEGVLAQPKRAALLAYLALARPRGFHSRDTLLGVFWSDSSDIRARNGLNQALHFLRRRLGKQVVLTRGSEEVGLDFARVWCDALAFDEALIRGDRDSALQLYAGDLLKGFYLSGHLEFERWLEHERSRLRTAAVQATVAAAREEEAVGNLAGTAHRLRQGLQWALYDEGLLRQLMSALAALGDRGGAVREYESFARRLSDDMQLQPTAETRSVLARITAPPSPAVTALVTDARPIIFAEPASAARVPVVRETSRANRRRRQLVVAAAVGVAALVGISQRAWMPSSSQRDANPKRVLVAEFQNLTGDPSFDPLGRIAADWTIQGLAGAGVVEVIPLITVLRSRPARDTTGISIAKETGAGLLVTGAYFRSRDSLFFHAHVTETVHGRLVRAVGPVGAPADSPLEAIETLRRRVTGALATAVDHRLAPWAQQASQPPSFEAYRVYVEGLDLFAKHDLPAAVERFDQAANADSGFTAPLIWIMLVHSEADQINLIDSVARSLSTRRERMAAWDRAMLDYHLAFARGDRAESYRAMQRVVEITPAPEWIVTAARDALAVNRPRAALDLLDRLGAERTRTPIALFPPGARYASLIAEARHRLGDYERELEALRRQPASSPLAQAFAELRPLAGLGRPNEALGHMRSELQSRTWSFALGIRMIESAEELQAHGFPHAANQVLGWATNLYENAPDDVRRDGRARHAYARTLYAAERWGDARRIIESLMAEDFHPYVLRGDLGLIAARLGNRAEAERMATWYADYSRGSPYDQGWATQWRARIAAVLGDRARAVRLMQQAYAEGWWRQPGHGGMDFKSLRGYPPFEELQRPID